VLGHGQALGERVHHILAREGGRLGGQPVRPGQLRQDRVDLLGGGRPAAAALAHLDQFPLRDARFGEFPLPAGVQRLVAFGTVLGPAGRHRRRARGLDPLEFVGVQPVQHLGPAGGEPLDQRPLIQPDDLRGT
jgi:hypothetical protein